MNKPCIDFVIPMHPVKSRYLGSSVLQGTRPIAHQYTNDDVRGTDGVVEAAGAGCPDGPIN